MKLHEECDDENIINGEGCSSTCKEEYGWKCTGEPSDCKPFLIKALFCFDHNTAEHPEADWSQTRVDCEEF